MNKILMIINKKDSTRHKIFKTGIYCSQKTLRPCIMHTCGNDSNVEDCNSHLPSFTARTCIDLQKKIKKLCPCSIVLVHADIFRLSQTSVVLQPGGLGKSPKSTHLVSQFLSKGLEGSAEQDACVISNNKVC